MQNERMTLGTKLVLNVEDARRYMGLNKGTIVTFGGLATPHGFSGRTEQRGIMYFRFCDVERHIIKEDDKCPKCKVGLGIHEKHVCFVSSHQHYKPKCAYTRTEYKRVGNKLNGTQRVVKRLQSIFMAEQGITAERISQDTFVKLKTVRNILGVLIKQNVVMTRVAHNVLSNGSVVTKKHYFLSK